MIAAIVLLAILSPLLLMAFYVENWSRDLTTNVAWTDPEAADAALRPVEFVGAWSELENAVDDFNEQRPNWSQPQPPAPAPEGSPIHRMTAPPEGETPFHLVRTTGLMRYRDDVWIVAEPIDKAPGDATPRWRLHAHSQSRVGKGDLGQNPRNLRELFEALRESQSMKQREQKQRGG